MDGLYSNLENYNEEKTISELQAENKDLKCKLEEYALTVDTLQKEILQDFDKLSAEYKKLELNYSSLLKTAKAEIERKTQIITNLNTEKDKMVLKCYQNKNRGSCFYDSPKLPQTQIAEIDRKTVKGNKVKNIDGNKNSSPYPVADSKEKDDLYSNDTTANSYLNVRGKLHSISNSASNNHSRTKKNSEVKENMLQYKKLNTFKTTASIKNRRKSMPALNVELDPVSDDDMASASSKVLQMNTEQHFIERPKSRISETSSQEERRIANEAIPDSHKLRSRRHDRDQKDLSRLRYKSSHRDRKLSPDMYKIKSLVRSRRLSSDRKISPERHRKLSPDSYKRISPDKYHSGSREFFDNRYQRSEQDKHRTKGRVLESPPRENFHQRLVREPLRNKYDRSQCYEQEKLPHQRQDKYCTKRRIDQVTDLEPKRARLEPYLVRLDNHRKRKQDERNIVDKKYMNDPHEIHFSSCESPDYDNLDAPSQQIKEIKLTAATKLDDPRLSSKKYIFNNEEDKVVLSTVIGKDVDIVPVSKGAWGIQPVSIPEALVKMPSPELKQSTQNICMEIENHADISLESGEISSDLDTYPQEPSKTNVSYSEIKEPVPVIKTDAPKSIDNPQKIHSYKIPKLKKTVEHNQDIKTSKETISSRKPLDNSNNSKNNDVMDCVRVNKQLLKLAKSKKSHKDNEEKQKECRVIPSNSQLPLLDSDSLESKCFTNKEVVEGDLEMSDDNCDDTELSGQATICYAVTTDSKVQKIDHSENCNANTDKQATNTLVDVISEPSKDKIPVNNNKKSSKKSKKKSKHREVSKSDDSVKIFDKPSYKEKVKKHRSKNLKTKFSELFDDSSSLICPEDLGLDVVPASTITLPDKCVPFFEDALDGADLNAINPEQQTKDSTLLEKSNVEENKAQSDVLDIRDPIRQVPEDLPEYDNQPAMTDVDIADIYKNIEPGDKGQEDGVVKTVVISTGVQPTVLLVDEKPVPTYTSELQIKTASQDVDLKALATSTPYKQTDVIAAAIAADPMLPDASCESNNDSNIASVEITAVIDKSDTNTMDSQASVTDVPDVRIFVKRRRKIIKK